MEKKKIRMPESFVNDLKTCSVCNNQFRFKNSFKLICRYHPGELNRPKGTYSCCKKYSNYEGCHVQVHKSDDSQRLSDLIYVIEEGSVEEEFLFPNKEEDLKDCRWFRASLDDLLKKNWKINDGIKSEDINLLDHVYKLGENLRLEEPIKKLKVEEDPEEKIHMAEMLVKKESKFNYAYNPYIDSSSDEDDEEDDCEDVNFIILATDSLLKLYTE